jgi:uncharacterized protein YrrD
MDQKHLLAIFNDGKSADWALQLLADKGHDLSGISFIAPEKHRGDGDDTAEATAEGATTGTALGGLAGLLAGAGVAPALAGLLFGGPVAAALGLTGIAATTVSGAFSGGVTGGLIGMLSKLGISKERAEEYAGHIGNGGIVLMVPVTDKNRYETHGILHTAGASEVQEIAPDGSDANDLPFAEQSYDNNRLFKAKDIIGRSIVSYSSGKILYKIYDVIHDPEKQEVVGFLVDETWMLAKGRHLPLSVVRSIGHDAVTVNDDSTVITAKNDPRVKRILDNRLDVRNNKIMTEEGEEVGRISDFFFNGETGQIERYEVSRGIGRDAYQGSAFLDAADVVKVGQEVVFVPGMIKEQLESQQTGGIKQTIDQAKSKTGEVAHSGREKVGAARGFGREYYTQTASQTAPVADELKGKASDAWTKIKEKVSDMKEQTAQQIEEKRIQGALGRPVTRVILDRDDKIILNTGDLITNEAVEKARTSNMLDALLNSVYTDKPDFTKEDLRANDDRDA